MKYPTNMLSTISLAKESPEIIEVPVQRTFGQPDMYKDDSTFLWKDQMRIETKLGKIESEASKVIKKVIDAHEAGHDEVSLSRLEKDILRKFQFVMKYRSPTFFERFNHQTADEYNAKDRTAFLEHMQENHFKRPLDVWLHDLIAIIDMPMDPAGEWTMELVNRIFPGDARWLLFNTQFMYLAFVTPSDESEEFILTENAFSIYEGPTSFSVDRRTGEKILSTYTEFHILNVISPKFAMVLRSYLLPESFEDKNEHIRKQRKANYDMHAAMHNHPEHVRSLLEDLPITKARKSYTVVRNERINLINGANRVLSATDKFTFSFFRLESRHIQMMNAVMLDQAQKITTIVFKSESALRKAIEFYLSMPTQTNGKYSMSTLR